MRARTRTLIAIALVGMAVAALLAGGWATSQAQSSDERTIRVIAQLLDDGRVEFGLRTPEGDLVPRARYFPTGVAHEDWLQSSALTLDDGTTVRIIARRSGDTRLEFGVRFNGSPENELPRLRFFPLTTTSRNWLSSSEIALPTAAVAEPEPPPPPSEAPPVSSPPQRDDPPTEDDAADEPEVERLVGGHRDGLIVNRNVIGDPDAPVLIAEYGDPY